MRGTFVLLAFLSTTAGAFAACPPPPAAPRDIIADSYYDDPPYYSHINQEKYAQYEAAVEPIEDYMGAVAKMASSGGSDDAECAVRWLVSWAEGDAMLGRIEKEQAHYERKWVLAGLALSYAKVRNVAARDQAAAVDTWLQALADGVMQHSAEYKGDRNNHYYWEGLAVAATGAVTGNARDLDWGRKVYADAMSAIADDGTFPKEMGRGSRALHYHLFSATPLAMLESILDEHSPKLVKLADFCIAGLEDPDGVVAKRAGFAQIGINPDDGDWLAVYARRHPSPEIPKLLVDKKPPYVNRLGGALDKPNPLEHPRLP
jgi:poly(beta-D-mannuronate) lyase